MSNTSYRTFTYISLILITLTVSTIKGEIVCQPGGLVSSANHKSEMIEIYYQQTWDDLVVMKNFLNKTDYNGDLLEINWDPNVDTIINDVAISRSTDNAGVAYWAEKRTDKKINFFLPGYFTSGLIIHFINESKAELVPSELNINVVCNAYFPPGTYQPYCCRDPARFHNNLLNYDISLNIALKNTILSVRESKSQYFAAYTYTFRGSLIGTSKFGHIDIGYLYGGNYLWSGFGNPFSSNLNQTQGVVEGRYSDPYYDAVSNTIIISAYYPFYLGQYFWGSLGIDINMNETRKLISEYEPTKNAFSILVNEDGYVILASERASRTLYNKSIDERDTLTANLTKLGNLFARARASTDIEIENISIDDVPYYVVYKKLQALTNWVYFVFAPTSDLKYDVSVNQTSFIAHVSFNESLSFGITLENLGSIPVKYQITIPEWISIEIVQQNISYPLPGNATREFIFNFIGINSGKYDGDINIFVEDEETSLCFLQNYEILLSVDVGPKLKRVYLDETASIAIFISCIISLLIPVCLIVFIVYHRQKPAINKISPIFTIVTLFGLFLFQMSPIFLTHQAPYCMVWWWLCTIGFVIFFGSLIVKAFRIERIFRLADKFKKAKNLTNKSIFPIVFILLGIQIILLIAWTVVTPLELIEYIEGANAEVICGPTNLPLATIFYSIQCVYAALFIVSGCYFSFKTRNVIRKDFREAKEMMFAVYNFSILVIIITGLAVANALDPTGFTIAVGTGTMLASIGSTCMLLGKRVFMVITNQTDSSSDQSSASKSKNLDFMQPEIAASV